jgi:carnitine O-acetyltransferase
MRQYGRLFGACRVPKLDCDEGRFYPDSRHIVVVSRCQYYWFEVMDEGNNLLLDTDGVGNALASILEDSNLQSDEDVALNSVGVLTAGARDGWAKCRERLCSLAPTNAQGISIIDSALFVVCLDNSSPQTAGVTCDV